MSTIPEKEKKQNKELHQALIPQDTLLKYKKPKIIVPEKKVLVSHYTHITGLSPLSEKDGQKTTEEILDTIFPPRYFEKDGNAFKQEVDRKPAHHWEVKDLNQRLDDLLKEQGASEIYKEMCPVRKRIFEQCFDEVLRQVTINMGERGLLLKRIKEELNMTLDSYHVLYLSATKYGVRKALIDADYQFDMEKRIDKLTQMKVTQEKYIAVLLADEEREVREDAEARETLDKEHTTECFLLRKKCRVLESQIRTKVIALALKKKTKKKEIVKKYKHKIFKT